MYQIKSNSSYGTVTDQVRHYRNCSSRNLLQHKKQCYVFSSEPSRASQSQKSFHTSTPKDRVPNGCRGQEVKVSNAGNIRLTAAGICFGTEATLCVLYTRTHTRTSYEGIEKIFARSSQRDLLYRESYISCRQELPRGTPEELSYKHL